MMRRTGATGPHWHVGPDTSARANFKKWFGANGGKIPKGQDGLIAPADNTRVANRDTRSFEDILRHNTPVSNAPIYPHSISTSYTTEQQREAANTEFEKRKYFEQEVQPILDIQDKVGRFSAEWVLPELVGGAALKGASSALRRLIKPRTIEIANLSNNTKVALKGMVNKTKAESLLKKEYGEMYDRLTSAKGITHYKNIDTQHGTNYSGFVDDIKKLGKDKYIFKYVDEAAPSDQLAGLTDMRINDMYNKSVRVPFKMNPENVLTLNRAAVGHETGHLANHRAVTYNGKSMPHNARVDDLINNADGNGGSIFKRIGDLSSTEWDDYARRGDYYHKYFRGIVKGHNHALPDEPLTYLGDVKRLLLEKGHITDIYSEVTPEMIRRVADDRHLRTFISNLNLDNAAKSLSRMGDFAATIPIGLGINQMNKNSKTD